MNPWRIFTGGIRALFGKAKLDAQMDDEMRSHIEMQTQENIEAGMKPEEARYAALRQFGWVESIKETCRDQRGLPGLETLGRTFATARGTAARTPASPPWPCSRSRWASGRTRPSSASSMPCCCDRCRIRNPTGWCGSPNADPMGMAADRLRSRISRTGRLNKLCSSISAFTNGRMPC